MEIAGDLENKSSEQGSSEPCLFSVEKRRPRGHMITLFNYVKGFHMHEGPDLLSNVPVGKSRAKKLKIQEHRFR